VDVDCGAAIGAPDAELVHGGHNFLMHMRWIETRATMVSLLSLFALTACSHVGSERNESLIGAWSGSVQFTTGAFAATKDLEFMYVFNAGGTMTESSNYDGAPPVPPAYGVWRKTGERTYEAKYTYFWTKPPSSFDDISKGGGWGPGGRGILTQAITVSVDGDSFDSKISYEVFDQAGKPTEKESVASANGTRITFGKGPVGHGK
jgi:hypothetical protein